MAEKRSAYRILGGNLKEEGHLEDQGVDGSIILNVAGVKW
jgi:hypothetical protein